MTSPPAPTPPGPDASPGTIVRWTVDVLNTRHPAPLRAVWGDGARMRTPSATHRGADAILAYLESLFAALPDATFTIQAMAEQGEDVFVRWTLTGTHTGAPLEGVDPTGARIDLDGMDHVTVHDGKLRTTFAIVDRTQLGHQLGLLPAEGSRIDVALRRGRNLLTRLGG